MLRRADNDRASQVEIRAQMQSVVRTLPRNFRDLIHHNERSSARAYRLAVGFSDNARLIA